MDKLIVNAEKIRGLGNILPIKSSNDFTNASSKITSTEGVINEENMTIYSVTYLNGSKLQILNNNFVEYNTGINSFTITCKLLYHTGNVIYSAPLTCIVNEKTTLTGTTNSNGECSFNIPLQEGISNYLLEIRYSGTNNVSGCTSYIDIFVGNLTSLELDSEYNPIQINENNNLVATLKGTNLLGEVHGIPGQLVNIYESMGYFKLIDSVTVLSDADGVNYCYSIGLDELDLDLSDMDFTLEFDYVTSVNGGRVCLGASDGWVAGKSAGDNYIYVGTSAANNGGYGVKTSGVTDNSSTGSVTAGDVLHWKIIRKRDTISFYLNNTLKGTRNISDWIDTCHNWSLYLQWWSVGDVTLSNVVLDIDLTLKAYCSKEIISSGEETMLTAQLIDTTDGSRVGLDNQTVNFYEVYTPELSVSASPEIIGSGEETMLTAQLIDTIDRSRIIDENINIYEMIPVGLRLWSSQNNINLGEYVALSGTFNHGLENDTLSNWIIQIYEDGTLLTTTRTDDNGEFIYAIRPGVGTHSYYAYRAESMSFDEFTSRSVNVMVNSTVPDSISLDSSVDVLSAYDGDSAVLTATVLDVAGNPLSNHSVSMKAYHGSTLVDTLTVSDVGDGTYTARYYGDGVGDVSIVAECNNLQDTYSLEDCMYYHEEEVSFVSYYTSGDHSSRIEDLSLDLTDNFEFSMECKSNINGSRLQLSSIAGASSTTSNYGFGFNRDSSGINAYYRTTSSNAWGSNIPYDTNYHNIKFVRNGNLFTAYLDNTSKGNQSFSWWNDKSPFGLYLWFWKDGTLTAKNIKIKKI